MAGNKRVAARALQEYIDMGGNTEGLVNSITSPIIKRKFTEEEWKVLEAKGPEAIIKALERMEFKGVR